MLFCHSKLLSLVTLNILQLHVLDETYVMNACREDCCYVSLDYDGDMRTAAKRYIVPEENNLTVVPCFRSFSKRSSLFALHSRSSRENSVARDYVLPDFTSLRRGFMKGREESLGRPDAANEGEQIIRMNNERFAVPELLFNPSDIGIEQESVRNC